MAPRYGATFVFGYDAALESKAVLHFGLEDSQATIADESMGLSVQVLAVVHVKCFVQLLCSSALFKCFVQVVFPIVCTSATLSRSVLYDWSEWIGCGCDSG